MSRAASLEAGWGDLPPGFRFGTFQLDVRRLKQLEAENAQLEKLVGWLPFLNTYRTMCTAPGPEFGRVLEQVREAGIPA